MEAFNLGLKEQMEGAQSSLSKGMYGGKFQEN